MPLDLQALLAPEHTAVLTMELQRGVAGDLAAMRHLADEVEQRGALANTGRLLAAAREAGARVVHCTFEARPDGAGATDNAPLLRAARRSPGHLVTGGPATELVPELGAQPSDIVNSRSHGLSPFGGTSLDATLRNLGVTTVVATGVSVNVGVMGLAIEAVNHGYRVVVPTDAVAGVPAEYAEAALANSIAMVATLTSVAEVIAAWATKAAN